MKAEKAIKFLLANYLPTPKKAADI